MARASIGQWARRRARGCGGGPGSRQRSVGPAEDEGVAAAGQFEEAVAGGLGEGAQGLAGGLAGDDAALVQQNLGRAQAALAVLEVDEREVLLPPGGGLGAVARLGG